jgi:hypothetical protein
MSSHFPHPSPVRPRVPDELPLGGRIGNVAQFGQALASWAG